MSKLEELKKQLDAVGERFKAAVEEGQEINAEMDRELYQLACQAVKGETFVLKVDDAQRMTLEGSDRVVLKLMELRKYGLAIRMGHPELILGTESGILYLPANLGLDLIQKLDIKVDTSIFDVMIGNLEKGKAAFSREKLAEGKAPLAIPRTPTLEG